ncbi:hypothetical protein SCHPADRAFT_917527 [Schizopora paradoxa]|uniref:CxC2-like cysteine cluster KDZ transposase-associated domain-containing protein n=1 Tax=Schizopora paradoxa TaxID=27342 RepID=A0A0H2RAD8_9AGAM|nr:hypothetical protein SCHPADRAFT_917527 [Schizopora paradoxa]
MATAPFYPTTAFSFDSLRVYHTASSRCPSLSIQAFVHALCDLHGVAYDGQQRKAFSSAYDIFVEINRRIDEQLDNVLYIDVAAHYAKACPPCKYKTCGEEKLKFSALFAIDGNESLKRVFRSQADASEDSPPVSTARPDGRACTSRLYIEAEDVNKFKDEVKGRQKAKKAAQKVQRFRSEGKSRTPSLIARTKSPCTDRWTNLAAESKKKMWGVFEETGIFLGACRHGVVMALCDMIRSGELAKYPIAIVNKLIDVFGDNILVGYDIGCGFSSTANNSPLFGPIVRKTGAQFCVNSFHGHAHCRKCQLEWHPTFVEGTGLEDFETCERVFSESNRVAATTRHTSAFHRRQAILRHFERWNNDKYSELSRFICNNYMQALENINTLEETLKEKKAELGIEDDDIFRRWANGERAYLRAMEAAPKLDRLAVQYVKTLQELADAERKAEETRIQWCATSADELRSGEFYGQEASRTRRKETTKKHGYETVITLQRAAADFEAKLGIDERWQPDFEEYQDACRSANELDYHYAVDRLEFLVVSRMFELSKLNRAGTGYKMRKHITKALKSRSKAIRTAVKKYNSAAIRLVPPRPELDIDDVLEYVFIAQFDLLRDSRGNVLQQEWARPAAREATSIYYKLLRSKEEIRRLNIEVRRLSTFIDDSERAMAAAVAWLKIHRPPLADQMQRRLDLHRAVNNKQRVRLAELTGKVDFTGLAGVGKSEADGSSDESSDEGEEVEACIDVLSSIHANQTT